MSVRWCGRCGTVMWAPRDRAVPTPSERLALRCACASLHRDTHTHTACFSSCRHVRKIEPLCNSIVGVSLSSRLCLRAPITVMLVLFVPRSVSLSAPSSPSARISRHALLRASCPARTRVGSQPPPLLAAHLAGDGYRIVFVSIAAFERCFPSLLTLVGASGGSRSIDRPGVARSREQGSCDVSPLNRHCIGIVLELRWYCMSTVRALCPWRARASLVLH